MKSKIVSLICVVLALSALAVQAGPTEPLETVTMTAGDGMKFNITRIEAHPGQKIHLQLKNTGTLPKEVMGHNWILLKAGQSAATYATSAAGAKDENFQPKSLSSEVLASLSLLGAGQSAEVDFAAPLEPGVYPFLCSFPGHFQTGMHGELVVK